MKSSGVPRIGSKAAAGSMLQATQAAVDAMAWLKPSDGAMVTLALKYAEQVDVATVEGDTRAVGYCGQQLHAVLRSLGGSPAERKALNIEVEANGKLAELRQARLDRVRGSAGLDSTSS
jgi:hypothetical protein